MCKFISFLFSVIGFIFCTNVIVFTIYLTSGFIYEFYEDYATLSDWEKAGYFVLISAYFVLIKVLSGFVLMFSITTAKKIDSWIYQVKLSLKA